MRTRRLAAIAALLAAFAPMAALGQDERRDGTVPAAGGVPNAAAKSKSKDAKPAAGDDVNRAARGDTPAGGAAMAGIASGPAFDLIYLKGQRDPMKVHATLPRPNPRDALRTGNVVSLTQFKNDRAGGSATVKIKADDIARVEFFEDLLAREGEKARANREFGVAFDLFARLVKMSPDWPGARDKLHQLFFDQAEAALAQKPPDYDAAIALALQLRDEDRKSAGVQSLMRRACLGRAAGAIKADDYAAARDQINLLLKHYPVDEDAIRLKKQLADKARALAATAEKAISGGFEEQRAAVGMLATARQVWPDMPGIDALILKAKRNYAVLNVATFDEPGTFEPLGAQSLTEFQACQLLFEPLFDLDESGGRFLNGPMIQEHTQRELGLKHRFAITRGLRWSDGQPVTAFDVEGSLRQYLDPRSATFDPERTRFIRDVLVEDPFTLSVELARAHPRPLALFTLSVLPRHLVAEPPKRGSDFSRAPVGTGPFRVGQGESTQQTKFVPNPEFRGAKLGQPLIKEVNFNQYVKSSAAVRDMDEGKCQLMTRLDPLETIRFAKLTGQFEVKNYLANSVYMLAINHRNSPLGDLRVRRAMLLAIDRQAILTQYFQAGPGGLAHRVVTGPFPTHSPAYDTRLVVPPKDEALAKQLVEEVKKAGLLTERLITLKYPQGDLAVEKAASQLRKDLEKVGFKNVRTEAKIEADLRHEVLDRQEFDLVYWRLDHKNVLYNITPLFDPDPEQKKPGGTNFMGYQHPELTRLFSQLRQEQRPLELWAIQQEIHRFLNREAVFVPLWQLDNYVAYTSKLTYRQTEPEASLAGPARQVPIHPLYLFRKTEGWKLEP